MMDAFGEKRHGDSWSKREIETKLNESYVEDFRAATFPNREKPKEEEWVNKQYQSFPKIQFVIKANAKN